ncbi:ribosome-binding factor A domain-containing protein [Ditylenchus destructor]|uniref:Ribosome-binding factor A domain-containing protein n=1 Tax=Ditylenchus destructor TaxID=166010 RepID=A0AAD4R0P2_9BILA|nr:ribosome-binding factor A domain-containing protein [Ditylenchus destructor]
MVVLNFGRFIHTANALYSRNSRNAIANCFAKHFARKMLRTYGDGQYLKAEDVKKILPTKKPRWRKLDEKQKTKMIGAYENIISKFFLEHEKLLRLSPSLSKVEFPTLLSVAKVHWKCTGDKERDEKIAEALEDVSSSLRGYISKDLCDASVPPVLFVPDRSHLIAEEMKQIFHKADYGPKFQPFTNHAKPENRLEDYYTTTLRKWTKKVDQGKKTPQLESGIRPKNDSNH